jgi:hypothetical protein
VTDDSSSQKQKVNQRNTKQKGRFGTVGHLAVFSPLFIYSFLFEKISHRPGLSSNLITNKFFIIFNSQLIDIEISNSITDHNKAISVLDQLIMPFE